MAGKLVACERGGKSRTACRIARRKSRCVTEFKGLRGLARKLTLDSTKSCARGDGMDGAVIVRIIAASPSKESAKRPVQVGIFAITHLLPSETQQVALASQSHH